MVDLVPAHVRARDVGLLVDDGVMRAPMEPVKVINADDIVAMYHRLPKTYGPTTSRRPAALLPASVSHE